MLYKKPKKQSSQSTTMTTKANTKKKRRKKWKENIKIVLDVRRLLMLLLTLYVLFVTTWTTRFISLVSVAFPLISTEKYWFVVNGFGEGACIWRFAPNSMEKIQIDFLILSIVLIGYNRSEEQWNKSYVKLI